LRVRGKTPFGKRVAFEEKISFPTASKISMSLANHPMVSNLNDQIFNTSFQVFFVVHSPFEHYNPVFGLFV
jgi:hypothetical protein